MTKQLFSQETLQKRRRTSENDKPVNLLTPPLRTVLGIGIAVAAGGTLWSIVADIPINVNGTGVLLPVSTINERVSKSKGIAVWMFDQPVKTWETQALDFRNTPNQFTDLQIIKLAENILTSEPTKKIGFDSASESSTRGSQISSTTIRQQYKGLKLPKDKLLFWIYSDSNQHKLKSATIQLKASKRLFNFQATNLLKQQKIITREINNRQELLKQMQELRSKNFITIDQVLQEKQSINQLQNQLLTILNEKNQIEQQVNDARINLRQSLSNLINNEMIFSRRSCYVLEITPNNGQFVSQGSSIISLSEDSIESPKLVPVFIGSQDISQVSVGNSILATPRGFQRAEVGGIKGRIVALSRLPSSETGIRSRVGVESIASHIMQSQVTPTLAIVALESELGDAVRNSGGYQWSSSGNLPVPPRAGDQLDVEITTRRMKPIEFVLPALNQFFGLTPPDKQQISLAGTKKTEFL